MRGDAGINGEEKHYGYKNQVQVFILDWENPDVRVRGPRGDGPMTSPYIEAMTKSEVKRGIFVDVAPTGLMYETGSGDRDVIASAVPV